MPIVYAIPGTTVTPVSSTTISSLGVIKLAARAATTAALAANTRDGNTLTANANGALGAIDGVTLQVGDRLLVKNEADGEHNGIYAVTDLGGVGAPWILTRTTDANTSGKMKPGTVIVINEGTVNGDSVWILATDGPIDLNTTALLFVPHTSNVQAIKVSGSSELHGGVDVVGVVTADVPDNASPALRVVEGGNQYLRINTTNGSEAIIIGGTGTNPTVTLAGTGAKTINGHVTFDGDITATNCDMQITRPSSGATATFTNSGTGPAIQLRNATAALFTCNNDGQLITRASVATVLGAGSHGTPDASATVIGEGATVTGAAGVAVGKNASVAGSTGTAVGTSASAAETNSVALGFQAVASHNGAFCLGRGAVSTAAFETTFGSTTVPNKKLRMINANGQQSIVSDQLTELHTLAAAATSDTTIQIPAASIVKFVTVRVTTAVTTSAGNNTFSVGINGAATRYGSGISGVLNTTHVGASLDVYGAATAIRFTAGNGENFTAGVIRVTIHYETAVAPTS